MKDMRKFAAALAMTMALAAPAMAAEVQTPAVLSGTVSDVIATGTTVQEGDVLMTVNSLAGPMAAARASASGTVKAVYVQPGASVQEGTVVVVLETK